MKNLATFKHLAAAAFCIVFAIAPLTASAQTTTDRQSTAATNPTDARVDQVDGAEKHDYSRIGLLGLFGLGGLLGRNRRHVAEVQTARADLRR